MKYRAIRQHEPEQADCLEVSSGESLLFERRPTGWEGWIWCTNDEGVGGWVPESWVEIDGGTCVAKKDYNSAELALKPGAVVLVGLLESGWAWVCTDLGKAGWVPFDCLEKIEG